MVCNGHVDLLREGLQILQNMQIAQRLQSCCVQSVCLVMQLDRNKQVLVRAGERLRCLFFLPAQVDKVVGPCLVCCPRKEVITAALNCGIAKKP